MTPEEARARLRYLLDHEPEKVRQMCRDYLGIEEALRKRGLLS